MSFYDYPAALKKESILNGRYIIKDIIGQGGFGITYKALDYGTGGIVAVKEYFPCTYVDRISSHSVRPKSEQCRQDFLYGKEKFLKEAKTLAAFIGNPNIVKVDRFFEEPGTGTAYFVMEFIPGITLSDYLQRRGGRISWQEARGLLLPVAQALDVVHSRGIIHRDIKPDNIIITDSLDARLIDFGAARYMYGVKSRSLETILTRGYAPIEQYYSHGNQGAWTDVYALAATMYFCITGSVPPESVGRTDHDRLKLPSSLGIAIPDYAETALLKALAVQPQNRSQSAREFASAVMKGETIEWGARTQAERNQFIREKEKELREQQEVFRQEEEEKLNTVWKQARQAAELNHFQGDPARQAAELKRLQEEQAKQAAELKRRQEEQARQAAELKRRQEEQARQAAELKRRQEEQARQAAELQRLKEEKERREADDQNAPSGTGKISVSIQSLVIEQRLISIAVIAALALFLMIPTGTAAFGLNILEIFILMTGFFILAAILFCLIPVFSDSIFKQALGSLSSRGISIREIEQDIDDISCKPLLAGRKYLVFIRWNPVIIPVSDLIWFYETETSFRQLLYGFILFGKIMPSSVRLIMRDSTEKNIGITKKQKGKMLELLRDRTPGVINEYSDELAQLRKMNFRRLVSAVDNNRKRLQKEKR